MPPWERGHVRIGRLLSSKNDKTPFVVRRAKEEMFISAVGIGSTVLLGVIFGFQALTNRIRGEQPVAMRNGRKVVVMGGGTGGSTVAALLTQHDPEMEVTVIEPRREQSFSPPTALAAGGHRSYDLGTYGPNTLFAPTSWSVTREAKLVASEVTQILPDESTVVDADGRRYPYDALVVASGCQWTTRGIHGLQPKDLNLFRVAVDPGIIRDNLIDTHYGSVLITRCGQTPQTRPCDGYHVSLTNVLWKFLKHFTRLGPVTLVSTTPESEPLETLPKECSNAVKAAFEERKIDYRTNHKLVSVDRKKRVATFETPDGRQDIHYSVLILEPSVTTPRVLRRSKIVAPNGFVNVDDRTLQHVVYPNVFAIGDCADLPISKSLGATFAQAPVVAHNVIQQLEGKKANAIYDGYTSQCITMSTWRMMWPQSKYHREPVHSYVWNNSTWRNMQGFVTGMYMQCSVYETMYWTFFLRGWWYPPAWGYFPTFPVSDDDTLTTSIKDEK